jgi:hypothetical protein
MNNVTLIESVLGFDLNAEIKSNDGQVIRTGIRKTCIACQDEYASVGTKLATKHWFTHYNQALLDKIRDMRRNID